jgi:hypothetical protein
MKFNNIWFWYDYVEYNTSFSLIKQNIGVNIMINATNINLLPINIFINLRLKNLKIG